MLSKTLVAITLAYQATAFPFVAETVGMDPRAMKRNQRLDASVKRQAGGEATCPYNANHVPAAGITKEYPYCGAADGLPGYQVCNNNLVPAKGDTAHEYQEPGPNDIRGPCPGLNTAANHNFLARDGITTFAELTDAQQNVYGVGYDLAVLLAVLGVGLDGDPITTKLSIGCEANTRTASPGLGPELGLDGHNKFEADTSLTRNDYFLDDGDNYTFNMTLYQQMLKQCTNNGATAVDCNRENIARYRKQRYDDSLAENGHFFFGPKSLLLFGASSFLYELFPSLGEAGKPDKVTMDYFFTRQELPPQWYSRVDPYTILDVAGEIFAQYELYPVAFGGNTGNPNTFVGLGEFGPSISGNYMKTTPEGVACVLYQLATNNVPSSLGGGGQLPTTVLQFAAEKLNPLYNASTTLGALACPLNFNNPS